MALGVFGEYAPHYYEVGANVLPIEPGTKRPPKLLSWRRWQHERQTPEEFRRLLAAHPNADVAIILGSASGGLVDIETDSPSGERALHELRLSLPPTPSWKSPRSLHRLYQWPRVLHSHINLRPGLDILAEGRYVVAPTSIGREWLTPGDLDAAVPLPAAWEGLLQREQRKDQRLTGQALRELEQHGVAEGTRNVTLASLVGRWLTQGYDEGELRRKALDWACRCAPPLPKVEALTVVASVVRTRLRTRSPERQAFLEVRARNLSTTTGAVLLALVVLRGELGLTNAEFAAPLRLVASLARVSPATAWRAYRELEATGLIVVGETRDPMGRTVSKVQLGLAP